MKTLSASYFIRVRNFGDRITPFLIENITGKIPRHVNGKEPHILGCGSILQNANESSVVWGSGFISSASRLPELKKGSVRAIRGHLSLERLKEKYPWIENVALGDPGSLLPEVYHPRKETKNSFGILPHYVDLADPFIKYCEDQGGLIIDPQRDVTDVIDDILSCQKILSSSLHGLILSDAYGVENRWIELSKEIFGERFKFHDYYTTRVSPRHSSEPATILKEMDLAEILNNCSLATPRQAMDDLYDAFPDEASCTNEVLSLKITSTFKQQAKVPVPVFVIFRDKLKNLKRVLRSLRHYDELLQPVICNCSDNRTRLEKYLKELKISGIPVYDCSELSEADPTIYKPGEAINHYFQQYSEPTNYVVTDCNNLIKENLVEKLQLFEHMLNINRQIDCVSSGFSTNSSDNPLYSLLRGLSGRKRHTEQFKPPPMNRQYHWQGQTIYCSDSCIVHSDFALYRAGYKYISENKGIRIRFDTSG